MYIISILYIIYIICTHIWSVDLINAHNYLHVDLLYIQLPCILIIFNLIYIIWVYYWIICAGIFEAGLLHACIIKNGSITRSRSYNISNSARSRFSSNWTSATAPQRQSWLYTIVIVWLARSRFIIRYMYRSIYACMIIYIYKLKLNYRVTKWWRRGPLYDHLIKLKFNKNYMRIRNL